MSSVLEEDPEPDLRFPEDNQIQINKPLIYITNSNAKSLIP
jgi:hypothetical protein